MHSLANLICLWISACSWDVFNIIWGKSVHAGAWAHERLQYHPSYVGIQMFCVQLWKLCIVQFQIDIWRRIAIKNNKNQVWGRTEPVAQDKSWYSPVKISTQKDANMRRVSNLWVQAKNPGKNHWTIGCYDCQSCKLDWIFSTKC